MGIERIAEREPNHPPFMDDAKNPRWFPHVAVVLFFFFSFYFAIRTSLCATSAPHRANWFSFCRRGETETHHRKKKNGGSAERKEDHTQKKTLMMRMREQKKKTSNQREKMIMFPLFIFSDDHIFLFSVIKKTVFNKTYSSCRVSLVEVLRQYAFNNEGRHGNLVSSPCYTHDRRSLPVLDDNVITRVGGVTTTTDALTVRIGSERREV